MQPHEGLKLRIVIGSASRFVNTKSCLTLAPRGTGPKLWAFSANSESAQPAASAAPPARDEQNHPSPYESNRRSHRRLLRTIPTRRSILIVGTPTYDSYRPDSPRRSVLPDDPDSPL